MGKQPCLKEWSPVTHPLLKSSFIDDGKPIRQKVLFFFWPLNGINGFLTNPGGAPILRTKSVTKKQLERIGTGEAWTKSQYHNYLGIVFKSEAAMLEGVVSHNGSARLDNYQFSQSLKTF